jgi:redox-regulated HSP33 family molecular chaperone
MSTESLSLSTLANDGPDEEEEPPWFPCSCLERRQQQQIFILNEKENVSHLNVYVQHFKILCLCCKKMAEAEAF